MDFLKLVRARYSVRQYQNRPVEPEKVEQLLEAVKAALGLPEHLEPVNILAVGYADGAPASPERWRTERIPLDELVLARA